ncbi:universal stress protein [Mangrovihabitans endophyticus]|uniref:Universal stress protein n=1 Tax=Mangrovihabitans endophyticus TaxID=1751298 RepID=A0A8J3BT54_9ACTN|nr:universal stress protein [Mangrovihabitans endophyticus]GGK75199.1 universal stress protein [Mangrovihabitans endophyticus]
MNVKPIVVATDGSESSSAAIRWAAREAQRRALPLRITHVFDWEWGEARYDMSHHVLDLARGQAEQVTADAVNEARRVAPRLEVTTDPVLGHPAARLIGDSGTGRMMVLGSRGRGGFGSLLLGSVGQRVATHAACPVVVVRGRGDVTHGPVVAGVDDSPAAYGVLETAFDAAASQNCALEIVRAFLPPPPVTMSKAPAVLHLPTPEADAEERVALEDRLAPWRTKFPDVPVTVVLTHQSIASVLVAASRRARLVIVGSRGHGVIAGTLLGSAGLQLLHHADCPVHIVRTRS